MKITKIEVQEKHPQRRSLYIDGEFFAGVDQEVVVRLGLEEDQEINEERTQDILRSEERRRAKEYGLNLLTYRIRSIAEIKRRLLEKGIEEGIIVSVIEDLVEAGLLNDLEFAREWVRSRMAGSPKGSYALRKELMEKEVPDEIIQEVLDEYAQQYDEREVAKDLAKQRMRVLEKGEKDQFQGRLADFLTRRGFSYEVIKDVLHQFSQQESSE